MKVKSKKKDIAKFLISGDIKVLDAMKKLDCTSEKHLFVVDKNRVLLGTLTDGDIRRFILAKGSLQAEIDKVYNKRPVLVTEGSSSLTECRKVLLKKKIMCLPVVDSDRKIIDIVFWDDIFSDKDVKKKNRLNVSVVIMAGGKGTRMDPFTRILPKPLIPYKDKAVVESIMDNYYQYGIKDFYLTINFKGEMIRSYFDNIKVDYKIKYIHEKIFLGTAGALKLLPDKISKYIIVNNCDTIINTDYEKIMEEHIKQKNKITIVGSIQNHIIPYGVIDYNDKGELLKIDEKPKLDFIANTGMYIINKSILHEIPENKKYDMNQLLNKCIANNHKVSIYPIGEDAWVDIGQWEKYKIHI